MNPWSLRRGNRPSIRPSASPTRSRGRFELYSLHVILDPAPAERRGGREAAETAQVLFDTFISALDNALREIGVGDLSVARKMRKLGEAFYGRAKAYDASLSGEGDDLEALIGRTVLEGQAEPGRPEAIAAYVRKCAAALAAQPLDAVLEGRIEWPDATA